MIKVTLGTNTNSEQVMVDENITLRECMENNNIDYARGTTTLDGGILPPGGIDKTFKELGIKTNCYLFNIIKADNAAK